LKFHSYQFICSLFWAKFAARNLQQSAKNAIFILPLIIANQANCEKMKLQPKPNHRMLAESLRKRSPDTNTSGLAHKIQIPSKTTPHMP